LTPRRIVSPGDADIDQDGPVSPEVDNDADIVDDDVDDDVDDIGGSLALSRQRLAATILKPVKSVDAVLKRSIASSAHSLVSAVLILMLALGSAVAATFLGYQIINECRDVGLSLKDTLSDLGSAGGQRSDDFLSEYRLQANEFIQEYLPTVFDWVEAKSDFILQANNLTAAAVEGRLLMEQLRGARYCSRDERWVLKSTDMRSCALTLSLARPDSLTRATRFARSPGRSSSSRWPAPRRSKTRVRGKNLGSPSCSRRRRLNFPPVGTEYNG
jgi:hypothetical protein